MNGITVFENGKLSFYKNGREFILDTREIRSVLGGVPLDNPEVIAWLDEYISEGLCEISVS